MPNYTPENKPSTDKGLYRVAQWLKNYTAKALLTHNNDETSHPNKVNANRITIYEIDKTNTALKAGGAKYEVGPAYLYIDEITYVPIEIENVDGSGAIVSYNLPTDKIYADVSISETKDFTIKQFDNDSGTLTLKSTIKSVDINTVNLIEELIDLRSLGMIYYTRATAATGSSGGVTPEPGDIPGQKFADTITVEAGTKVYQFNHGMNNRDLIIQAYMDGELIYVNTKIDSANAVSIDLGDADTTLAGKQIRIVIISITQLAEGGVGAYKWSGNIDITADVQEYTVAHNLNSADVFVQISVDGEIVIAKTIIADADHIKINIGDAATAYAGKTAHVIVV